MYVIIFSIDKNYELYRELEEGRKMMVFSLKYPRFAKKNPPNPLVKGESHQLDPKQILIIRKSYFLKNSWGAPR